MSILKIKTGLLCLSRQQAIMIKPSFSTMLRTDGGWCFALTGYLRWRTTGPVHLHLGGQRNWGGEAKVNGVALNNPPENTRIHVGASLFLPDKQQLILRLAKETQVRNGFRAEHEVALRYQKGF